MSLQESTFKFQKVTDILNLPDPEFIIENLIVKGSFAVLFGPPGVGKSFLALSWAFAVAAGKSWQGRKVNGGPVIYIAAEGFGGLKLRVAALLSHGGYGDDTPCRFLDRPISLKDSVEVKAFIAEINNSVGKPALIIIDTLARCFVGGDENSAKDMGLFIHGVETVKRETGATVLVVHHTGKNERSGARGSSALMGAADTMIECSADRETMTIECEKQKDAEPFPNLALELSVVDLGHGKSSCILKPIDLLKGFVSPADNPTANQMLGILEKFEPEGATATVGACHWWQRHLRHEQELAIARPGTLPPTGIVQKHVKNLSLDRAQPQQFVGHHAHRLHVLGLPHERQGLALGRRHVFGRPLGVRKVLTAARRSLVLRVADRHTCGVARAGVHSLATGIVFNHAFVLVQTEEHLLG